MKYPYNLHAHSLLSDGVLLPSEIAVRYGSLGYKTVAITDHTDYSNIDANIKALRDFCQHWPAASGIEMLPGLELTHVPPEQFVPLARYARENGMKIIVAHGETTAEPMLAGTNRAALEAPIDILAHPGVISDEDVRCAAERGIFLELTSRKAHGLTNEHVARKALAVGAGLIINHDSHTPEDIITPDESALVGIQAGLSMEDMAALIRKVEDFLSKKRER